MLEQKETRSSEATPERAGVGAGLDRSSTSTSKSTTSTPPGQAVKIADFLGCGADHGIHLSDLVRLTGLPERTVRQMVHQERRQHIPILSNNLDGYFLPGSEYERSACIRSLRCRAGEILEAADGIEGADMGD